MGWGGLSMSLTLYAQLMDRATEAPLNEIVEALDVYFAKTNLDLSARFIEMLRDAYTEGARDGFQQGLIAAEAAA